MNTNTDTKAPHVIRVEDHEYEGTCSHCGREGLRWIVVMSDGATIGSGCMKKALGIPAPAPASYRWVSNYTMTAEYVNRAGQSYALWQHRNKVQGCISINGNQQVIGGYAAIEKEWHEKWAS